MMKNEAVVVEKMVRLYCRKKHGVSGGICPECSELLTYALQRYDQCPFGDEKPVCSQCRVHCYREPMRGRIREVMRFAGPRMIFIDPINAFRYLIAKKMPPKRRQSKGVGARQSDQTE